MDNQPMANTDKELWRTVDGDYYSKHTLYLTERGGLTLCEGGTCITLPPEDWFRLANQLYSNKHPEYITKAGKPESMPPCHYQPTQRPDRISFVDMNNGSAEPYKEFTYERVILTIDSTQKSEN